MFVKSEMETVSKGGWRVEVQEKGGGLTFATKDELNLTRIKKNSIQKAIASLEPFLMSRSAKTTARNQGLNQLDTKKMNTE